MPPTLVLDVYDKIAQALRHLSEHSTLLALASTCHAMHKICLKELFHSISLLPRACDVPGTRGYSSDDDIPARYLQLRLRDAERLIAHAPHTAALVRALNVQCHASSFGDAGLLLLLAKFDALQAISLSTFYVPSADIIWGTAPSVKPLRCFAQKWPELPTPFANALCAILRLPSVSTVEMQFFQDIPLGLFRASAGLATLRLLYCGVAGALNIRAAQRPDADGAHTVRLRVLEFGLGPKSIAPLLYAKNADGTPLLDTSSLVSLAVHLDSEREELIEFLFNLRGIKHLLIDSRELSYASVPVLFSHVPPAVLQNLESLRLHLTWRTPVDPSHAVRPTDICATLSGLAVLAYLELSITVQTAVHNGTLLEDMGRLDALLADTQKFAALRRVSVGVYFDLHRAAMRGGTAVDRGRWLALRSTHFPRLLARPLLELEVIIRV